MSVVMHDKPPAVVLVARLPVPPSANRYWRNVKGRTILSAEAREYKQAVAMLLSKYQPIRDVPVVVHLSWYRADLRGDLDNRIKCALDSIQGALYANDRQIVELHAWTTVDRTDPRLEITVQPADDWHKGRV